MSTRPPRADSATRADTDVLRQLIGWDQKDAKATPSSSARPARTRQSHWHRCMRGFLCDIADAAMGIAFASTLAPDGGLSHCRTEIISFGQF